MCPPGVLLPVRSGVGAVQYDRSVGILSRKNPVPHVLVFYNGAKTVRCGGVGHRPTVELLHGEWSVRTTLIAMPEKRAL